MMLAKPNPINKNMTLPHANLFPESPSQIPNLTHAKPLYLYSARYNKHQKLRRTAKGSIEEYLTKNSRYEGAATPPYR